MAEETPDELRARQEREAAAEEATSAPPSASGFNIGALVIPIDQIAEAVVAKIASDNEVSNGSKAEYHLDRAVRPGGGVSLAGLGHAVVGTGYAVLELADRIRT